MFHFFGSRVLVLALLICFGGYAGLSMAFPANFVNETLLSGVGRTLTIDFLPDGRMITGQKNGNIRISDPAQNPPLTSAMYMQLTGTDSNDERGLLELELDPDFSNNGYFYILYNHASTGLQRVSRFQHQENSGGLTSRGSLGSETVLWQDTKLATPCCHYGGGLDFGPDGKLYIVIGDKFDSSAGQDLTRYGGKILRINSDGSVPSDNPDFSVVDASALPEIWAYGLRNPFRAHWDITGGRFLIGEVGGNIQSTATEDVHLGVAGANYGWPNCEGSTCNPGSPSTPAPFDSYAAPLFSYPHSGAGSAIVGGFVYRGSQFPALYQGAYFYGDYVRNFIRYLTFDGSGNVTGDFDFESAVSNPGSNAANAVAVIEQGPDGSLYYGQLNNAESVKRVRYVGVGNQPPVITQADATPLTGSVPLDVNFIGAATDQENDSLTYHWIFGDGAEADGSSVSHQYTSAGVYTAYLQVSDQQNSAVSSSAITISVGQPPTAGLSAPADGDTFRAGDTISFSASANDPDGVLTASSYSWELLFLHDSHFHTGPVFSGSSGSFMVETTGHDWNDSTRYELILTVTDSDGLTDTESVFMYPEKVDLSFDTSPSGQTLLMDGIPRVTPFVYDTLIDFEHGVSALSPVCIGQAEYAFASWSDAGAATHTIVVPGADTSYTATYNVTGNSCSSIPGSGLVLHLESDQGLMSAGGVVTSWVDLSGQGNDLTAVGGPALVSTALVNYDAVRFDGVDDLLERTSTLNSFPSGNGDRTVVYVVDYRSAGWGGLSFGTASSNQTFGLVADNLGNLAIQGWSSSNDFKTTQPANGAGWMVQSVVLKAGQMTHYKDGAQIDSQPHTYNTTLGSLVMGAKINAADFVDMDVAAAVVYNRALSLAERAQVEGYLNSKYLSSTPPTITVTSPVEGVSVQGPDLVINYNLAGQGYNHIHFTLDTDPRLTDMTLSGSYTIADVVPGAHMLKAELVDGSHTPLTNPEATVVVNFTVLNSAPVISGTPATSINPGVAYSFVPTASDPDSGDNLIFSIVNKPAWMSFNTSTGELSGTPVNGDVGTTTGIVITVDDQQAAGNSTVSLPAFDLEVTNTNAAPTISGTPATTVEQGAAYSFTPTASDADSGTVLSFSINKKPGWASFSTTTGTLAGTPTATDVGITTTGIVITVNDQQGLSNSTASLAPFDLVVTSTATNTNTAPVITGTPGTTAEQGTAYSFTPTASDADSGTVLSFSINKKPGWASFSTTTGTLTGTPTSTDVGVTTTGIVITVNDQQGMSNSTASLAPFDLSVTGAVDSNNDGITDAQAIALGLDPNSLDSDGDGISDADEVGNVSSPADTDNDGVIDALEIGAQANNAMVANNVMLDGGATVSIDVSAGAQNLTNVSTAAATGSPPAGVSFPFGIISYTTTSPPGGSVAVRMSFSSTLPANMDLYKVDGAGNYTALDAAVWTRVSNTVLEIVLTDGDAATDLDGVANGVIVDPLGVAAVTPAAPPAASGGGGGGGCVVNAGAQRDPTLPVLLLIALLYFARRFSRRVNAEVNVR